MKNIWKYIAVAAVVAFAGACTPSYPEIVPSALPQAASLDVQIEVDQETNYVTFSVSNPGVVPVWIFGDQLVDGKANKKYSYPVNGLKLRFRAAGQYSVEVKAYNGNGLSQGSLLKTFTLENTYRDPFDPAPYIRAVSGGASQNWVWNSTEDGHFGCGPSLDAVKGWWSCEANGKAGFLYDDILTFDSEGNYTFDPVDGQAYANKGSEYKPEARTGDEDYLFPAELKTTKYTFENNWNDAGIEEIYLVLEEGSVLSYVPYKSVVEEPRFLVMESKTSEMKKKLQLAAFVNTPDNPDGIAWYYEFVPEGSVGVDAPASLAEALVGSWTWDADINGHFGCGETLANPLGWWSGEAHCKDDASMYNDVMTFTADGKYTFDPVDGKSYINKGVTLFESQKAGSPYGDDFDINVEKVTVDYTLDEDGDYEVIKLADGAMFSYIPNDDFMDDMTLYVKSYTKDQLILMSYTPTGNGGGSIAWQFILKRVTTNE